MTGNEQSACAVAPRLVRPVPPLGPPPASPRPPLAERVTSTGVRVLAVRRPGVPLVEVRLRVPVSSIEANGTARTWLLAACLLSGQPAGERGSLTELIECLGAGLTASADSDRLMVTGTVLARYLGDLLELLVSALVEARYDEEDVSIERSRLITRLTMARSRASTQAWESLRAHLFGQHPYAHSLPRPAAVAEVIRADLLALHERRIVPRGSALVLVGDLDPETALDTAERVLGGWDRSAEPVPAMPALPAAATGRASRLIHRGGSVQSSIRIGGPVLRRDHPKYAALELANLLYGGYFSGRLIQNIREDKGYCYDPRSKIEHGEAGGVLIAEADVATAHTAAALLEMRYELGRLSTLMPTGEELDSARRFATGTLTMQIATQNGLADSLATLLGDGLDLGWVTEHLRRLAQVSAHDICDLGVHLLTPHLLGAVVIGDAYQCEEPLRAFGPWEVEWALPGHETIRRE